MKKTKQLLVSIFLLLAFIAPIFSGCNMFNSNTYTIDSNFKTTYYVGDALDCSNAYIYYKENGKEKSIAFYEYNISGFSTDKAGSFKMKISFKINDTIKTLTKSYTVLPLDETKTVAEIVSLNNMQYSFYQNDFIYTYLNGVTATIKYTDNSTSTINVNSSMFTNLSTSEVGENKTFTFTYNGVSKSYNYTVLQNVYVITRVTGIETIYNVGDAISLKNAEVTYTKNGKETGTWAISEKDITNFSTDTTGTRKLTINVLGTTYSLEYIVYKLNDLVEGKLYYYQCNDSNGKYIYVYVMNIYQNSGYFYIGFSSASPSTVASNPGAISKTNLRDYYIEKQNSFITNSILYDTVYSSRGSSLNSKFQIYMMDASGSACTINYFSSVTNSTATASYRLYQY